jgi:hypothetical protein
MWRQPKNFTICGSTLILIYLCFALQGSAQVKSKYIGIGMYIGPHAVNFMRGKGFETSYWSDAHYVNTYYEQAKRRLKFHLQREFFLTYNNRIDVYCGYHGMSLSYPIDNSNISAQLWARYSNYHNYGIRYHKNIGKLRLSAMTGYSSRNYFEVLGFGIPGNLTNIPAISIFRLKNHGIHGGLMVSISPKDFIDVSVRYEYFYYFLTDAHKQMVKNTAEEMMHYIDKSNQQFFDTYIPNHQHGLLSVGVTLRVNRLLNLHTFKFFDKKIKS